MSLFNIDNKSLHYSAFRIYRKAREVFSTECFILELIAEKHYLDFTNDNLKQRKEITKNIKVGMENLLDEYQKDYQKNLLAYEKEIELYELNKFVSFEPVPNYISFLRSIGFPFDLENIDKEDFLHLISEIKQTPEFIEYKAKRNDFIDNTIRPLAKIVATKIDGFEPEIFSTVFL